MERVIDEKLKNLRIEIKNNLLQSNLNSLTCKFINILKYIMPSFTNY